MCGSQDIRIFTETPRSKVFKRVLLMLKRSLCLSGKFLYLFYLPRGWGLLYLINEKGKERKDVLRFMELNEFLCDKLDKLPAKLG